MSLVQLSKRVLRQAGVAVVREHNTTLKYVENPPAGLFDLLLLEVFGSFAGRRFIQIGANDGVRGDPVFYKVRDHGWSGLLIEPLPDLFAELQRNYAGQPGLTFLNAAVDAVAGSRTLHRLRPGLAVPDWAHGLPTFDRARLQKTAGELGLPADAIIAQEVPTIAWAGVLAAFGNGPCDVLVVDAEAHDIPILRAAPLARLRPRIIHFEHGCAVLADRLAWYGELIGLGYELATDGPDTIAWLRPAASP
jgi:FkbM family methyltransferase